MKVKIAIILSLIAIGIYFLIPAPPKAIVETPQDDTGMSREQTEDLMRTIGYVQ
jgi:hypothetical protein